MSTAISGANGTVHVGSANADVSGATVDIEVGGFDTTTTADLGWEDETGTQKKLTFSFDFFYNVAKKPTGGTLTLTPGTVATVTIYVDEVNQPGEVFTGSGLIKKLSIKSKVKDGWMITASGRNKGPWTLPS
jgi:hypothetical protein